MSFDFKVFNKTSYKSFARIKPLRRVRCISNYVENGTYLEITNNNPN